jgi:hypothetical protein
MPSLPSLPSRLSTPFLPSPLEWAHAGLCAAGITRRACAAPCRLNRPCAGELGDRQRQVARAAAEGGCPRGRGPLSGGGGVAPARERLPRRFRGDALQPAMRRCATHSPARTQGGNAGRGSVRPCQWGDGGCAACDFAHVSPRDAGAAAQARCTSGCRVRAPSSSCKAHTEYA